MMLRPLGNQKSSRMITALLGVMLVWLLAATAHGAAREPAQDYVSVYVLGSLPSNRDAAFQGGASPDTTVGNGVGGGIKGGMFPRIGKGLIGIELEWYGHGGDIKFPLTSGAGAGQRASTTLTVFNTMANLIVRYPGEKVIPYAGAGLGVSHSFVTGTTIPGDADTDLGGSWTLGYQFLAGVQGNLTDQLFLFGEYKYFAANYHWEQLALHFRTQYLLGGIGWRF